MGKIGCQERFSVDESVEIRGDHLVRGLNGPIISESTSMTKFEKPQRKHFSVGGISCTHVPDQLSNLCVPPKV
jgi:hypothetical protein